jgi:hypothetical protein
MALIPRGSLGPRTELETIPTGTTATATIGALTTRSGTIAVVNLADKALVPTALGTKQT